MDNPLLSTRVYFDLRHIAEYAGIEPTHTEIITYLISADFHQLIPKLTQSEYNSLLLFLKTQLTSDRPESVERLQAIAELINHRLPSIDQFPTLRALLQSTPFPDAVIFFLKLDENTSDSLALRQIENLLEQLRSAPHFTANLNEFYNLYHNFPFMVIDAFTQANNDSPATRLTFDYLDQLITALDHATADLDSFL